MLNLISSVLQQECKQESENLEKGRITDSQAVLPPPPEKIAHFPKWRTVSRIFISGPWQVCLYPCPLFWYATYTATESENGYCKFCNTHC